jgi:hypothetical protein
MTRTSGQVAIYFLRGWKRIESQFFHWKILNIIREQREFMNDSDCRNGGIGRREHNALRE